MEERIKEDIRAVYRRAWNLPHIRDALSHCPHIMLYSVLDLCEGTTVDMARVAERAQTTAAAAAAEAAAAEAAAEAGRKARESGEGGGSSAGQGARGGKGGAGGSGTGNGSHGGIDTRPCPQHGSAVWAGTMRRLSREVYREYQRQLWDPCCLERPAGTEEEEEQYVQSLV